MVPAHAAAGRAPDDGPLGVPACVLSTAPIFVAELRDRSQLAALWFSTRYRWWLVLAGVTAATLAVHLGSVAIGRALDQLLPERLLLGATGLSLFTVAAWSVRGDTLDSSDAERQRGRFAALGGFGVAPVAFCLSELRDKTQLATVSLAGDQPCMAGVWLSSTLGMALSDAVAVAGGVLAGKPLPQRAIAIGAAALM